MRRCFFSFFLKVDTLTELRMSGLSELKSKEMKAFYVSSELRNLKGTENLLFSKNVVIGYLLPSAPIRVVEL